MVELDKYHVGGRVMTMASRDWYEAAKWLLYVDCLKLGSPWSPESLYTRIYSCKENYDVFTAMVREVLRM